MDPASIRRLVVTALGMGAVALNKKYGVEISDVGIEAIAAIVLGFIGASNWKETALDKAEKAHALELAKVRTPEAVVDAINKRAEVTP